MSMTRRFQRSRWSETRMLIDAMNVKDELTFPLSQYSNVHSSVLRLNDAYNGRRKYREWRGLGVHVERLK